MQNSRNTDDIDDFMANLINRQPEPTPTKHRPFTAPRRPHKQAAAPPRKQTIHQAAQSKPKKRIGRIFGILLLLVLLVAGGFLLWKGPVSSLLTPPSPFSHDIQDKMDIPLYYPTKLPGSFKIETGSITQPEPDVVLYAISDDEGKKINISLQKRPEGINLDPLYAVLRDIREINTNLGTIKYGTSEDGIMVANILTDKTWIIVNSEPDILNDEILVTLISSLRY